MTGDSVQIKKLTKGLFLSGALNIILISVFFYWMIRERPPTPYFELKPANIEEQQAPFAVDESSSDVIRYFKTLTLEQLVAKLSNSELVESGYRTKDLALACLVTFHHFDLSRALLDDVQPTQSRVISFGLRKDGKPAKVLVYPGLSEKQYDSIIRFAKRERWPLNSKGLFLNLKSTKNKTLSSLAEAFYLTPEFISVEMLFNRADTVVQKTEILNVLIDGTFAMLSSFTEHQKQSQDLTAARRQHFLLEYIKNQSKNAAYLLLKTDGPVIVRKLDDLHIKMILSLLTDKTPEAGKFALTLLTSPRGDAVWQMAAIRLYEYAGEEIPEHFQHHAALLKFLPANMQFKKQQEPPQKEAIAELAPAQKKPEVKSQPQESFYIVQEGDSLWKISRRYDVDIDLLKKHNQLSSDFLKPGIQLKIP
jgi:LysM repeat protein